MNSTAQVVITAAEAAYKKALDDVLKESKKTFHVDAASQRQVALVVKRVRAKL